MGMLCCGVLSGVGRRVCSGMVGVVHDFCDFFLVVSFCCFGLEKIR